MFIIPSDNCMHVKAKEKTINDSLERKYEHAELSPPNFARWTRAANDCCNQLSVRPSRLAVLFCSPAAILSGISNGSKTGQIKLSDIKKDNGNGRAN